MSEPPSTPSPHVPPENLASPIEMEWGDDVTWWKPGFVYAARMMGWKWLFLLPTVAVIAMLAFAPTYPMVWQLLWVVLGVKLLIVSLLLPFGLVSHAFSNAIKSRAGPFCIHCGYALEGLPDNHRCPECGRPYRIALIEEYRRDPQAFIQRWKVRHNGPKRDQPFVAGKSKRKRRDGT
jgi:hypothetical protein